MWPRLAAGVCRKGVTEVHYKNPHCPASNCLAVAARGKEVPTYPPPSEDTEHSTVHTHHSTAPGLRSHTYKWDAWQFPPYYTFSIKLQREFCTCVHHGKGKNSTMASAGSPTATPDTKSQKESTPQKVGGRHPGDSGHLYFLRENRSCCNTRAASLLSAYLEAHQKPITLLSDVETGGHSNFMAYTKS